MRAIISNMVEAKKTTLAITVVADRLNMPETIAITRNTGNNFNIIHGIFISKIELNIDANYRV
jgi:hypothetical protein